MVTDEVKDLTQMPNDLDRDNDALIEQNFWELFEKLPDRKFWQWVGTWYDTFIIKDACETWNIKDMQEEIPDMELLLKGD